MRISVAAHAKAAPQTQEVADLRALFDFIAPESGEVVIPCTPPPSPVTKEYEDYLRERKNAAPMVFPVLFNDSGRKRGEDVLGGTRFLAIDVDSLRKGEEDALCDKIHNWQHGQYAVGMYTTFKHTEQAPRVRYIVGLDRDPTVQELQKLWYALNLIVGGKSDGQTKDVTRGYFAWSRPSWREEGKAWFTPGADFSVDTLLKLASAQPTKAAPVPEQRPKEPVTNLVEGPRILYRQDYETLLEKKRKVKNKGPFTHNTIAFLENGLKGDAWGDPENRNDRMIHGLWAIVDEFATEFKETSIDLAGSLAFFERSRLAVQEQKDGGRYTAEFLIASGRERLARVAERRAARPKEFAMTDAGNGERIAYEYSNMLKYVAQWNRWMAWDGKRWSLEQADSLVYLAVKDSARRLHSSAVALAGEDPEYADTIKAWALRSENNGPIRATTYAAQRELSTTFTVFDSRPMLLNVQNGTIDLATGKLLPHNPDDHLTKIAQVEYRAGASCPKWQRFVSEVTGGDSEMVGYLQRYLGYCLTGEIREHALLFALGSGGNGKSVLFNTIANMLGEYAVKCPIDMLLARRGEKHETEFAVLHGARLAIVSETEVNRAWATSKVKDLTGGDRITARRMREDFWEFDPTHKFVVMTNHEPRVVGSEEGIWRRVKKVPFDVSFRGRENRMLSLELRDERAGILNWLIEGCLAWQRDGLREPAKVTEATELYKREEDVLGKFLEECCDRGMEYKSPKLALRAAYVKWCAEEGYEPLGAKLLAKELRAHGIAQETSGSRGWWGVRLSPSKLSSGPQHTKLN